MIARMWRGLVRTENAAEGSGIGIRQHRKIVVTYHK
jgi:hypothetical protein